MQEAKRNLGQIVKKARKKQKLTQENVAEKLGIQPRTVLEIENGRGNPTFDILYALIRALNISPDNIFYDNKAELSGEITQFLHEIALYSEDEQKLALAAANAVLKQISENRQRWTVLPEAEEKRDRFGV